jgi:hypothetical protein
LFPINTSHLSSPFMYLVSAHLVVPVLIMLIMKRSTNL